MKPYIFYELNLFIKNAKNKLMFLTFTVFLLIISFFIFFRDTGNIEHTQYTQMNLNRIAIGTLSENIGNDPEQSAFYDKLYDQQQLVASQDVAIRFEEDDWYVDAGLNLSQLQIDMHESHEFDDLDDEVRTIVPTLYQAETNQAFLTYIHNESLPLLRDREHATGFLITFFDSFGVASFIFLLLFSCSILSNDLSHRTMVKGYPLSYGQKTASKVLIYTIASFLVISLVTAVFTVFIGLVSGAGPLRYPMVLYRNDQYTAVSIALYGIRYSFYILALSLHVTTLSAFLNTVTKNMYATLFAGLSLYAVPLLILSESPVWRWVPLQYYQVSRVLSGETAFLTGQSQLTYSHGLCVLIAWSFLFACGIYGYEKFISRMNSEES